MADYGLLDRVLHRIALQFGPTAELSFDIDQQTSRPDSASAKQERHVFVSGLARSGTTILMRRIYASGSFCSLTYRHMPFILAPNIWSRVANASKRKDAPTERAHGDRILVDVDSPESLDEVFWRVFDGENYISRTHLRPHEPDLEISDKFAAYVAAILKADPQGRTRYLSKNNNNILRLQTIRRIFPNALILIPFREPQTHAGSLLRQHRNFVKQQGSDTFIRGYMTWLAHHEFGLEHRPFRFDQAGAERLKLHDPDTLNYWLEIWCQAYRWLEQTAPKGSLFVCYEDLCEDPGVWLRIAELCGTSSANDEHEAFIIAKGNTDSSANSDLACEASTIYQRLVERSRSTALQG